MVKFKFNFKSRRAPQDPSPTINTNQPLQNPSPVINTSQHLGNYPAYFYPPPYQYFHNVSFIQPSPPQIAPIQIAPDYEIHASSPPQLLSSWSNLNIHGINGSQVAIPYYRTEAVPAAVGNERGRSPYGGRSFEHRSRGRGRSCERSSSRRPPSVVGESGKDYDHGRFVAHEEDPYERQRGSPYPSSMSSPHSYKARTTLALRDLDNLYEQYLASRSGYGTAGTSSRVLLFDLKELCLHLDALPGALYVTEVRLNRDRNGGIQSVAGGSYSDVYQAKLGRHMVALKVLRVHQNTDKHKLMKLREMFLNEALLWSSCNHKHIVPFLGVDEENFPRARGRICIVLPWMMYGSVLHNIPAIRNYNSCQTCISSINRWISQIAEGLAYLHSCDIIHGDLRAVNVLLDEDKNVRLTDFGLSRAASDIISQSSSIHRTPNWLAPELLELNHSSKPTLKGDVYSFGCVAIELYTGNPPYAGHHWSHVVRKVLSREPIPQPRFYNEPYYMSNSIWHVVNQCFAADPACRPVAHEIPYLLSLPGPHLTPSYYYNSYTGATYMWPQNSF